MSDHAAIQPDVMALTEHALASSHQSELDVADILIADHSDQISLVGRAAYPQWKQVIFLPLDSLLVKIRCSDVLGEVQGVQVIEVVAVEASKKH